MDVPVSPQVALWQGMSAVLAVMFLLVTFGCVMYRTVKRCSSADEKLFAVIVIATMAVPFFFGVMEYFHRA